jgi:hypothetical protein
MESWSSANFYTTSAETWIWHLERSTSSSENWNLSSFPANIFSIPDAMNEHHADVYDGISPRPKFVFNLTVKSGIGQGQTKMLGPWAATPTLWHLQAPRSHVRLAAQEMLYQFMFIVWIISICVASPLALRRLLRSKRPPWEEFRLIFYGNLLIFA